MNALDQARRDLQKAERKLARVQQELQQRQVDVEKRVAKLDKIRASSRTDPTFSEISATSELEQNNVLHIIEATDEEIPDQEPLFDANETIALNLNDVGEPASEVQAEEPASEISQQHTASEEIVSVNLTSSEEAANVESASDVENTASLEIAALEEALEESTQALNIGESAPTETPAKPTPRRRASAPRSSKASPLPRTTTSRRSPAKRAKPKDTNE